MEADNFKDGLHKPTFHEDGYKQSAKCGDNFKNGLDKPTFQEEGYMRQRKPTISRMVFTSPPSMRWLASSCHSSATIQGWSSRAHLPFEFFLAFNYFFAFDYFI